MLHLVILLYWATMVPAATITLPDLTVSAVPSANREGLFASGAVSGEAWEQSGGKVETALHSIPGLSFSAAGGPGQNRSVFLRGAKAEHTLVLIDGMPVNDPLSPSRSFDFGLIPVGDISRIEVIKGPQSVLFGSDAMGGVVQVFTRGESAPARLLLEGGSFDTWRATASAHGIHGSFTQSRGFSAADEREGNTEADAHRAWNLGFRKAFLVGGRSTLRTQGFYQAAKTDTDRNGGPGGDSFNTFTRTAQAGARAELSSSFAGGWDSSVAASAFRRARLDTTLGNDTYRGLLWRLDASVKRESETHTPRVGLTYNEESGRSNQLREERRFRSGALYAQEEFSFGRAQFLAGARADFHDLYGPALTYRAGAGYWLIPRALLLRGSLGTGFKSPSLFQISSVYGSSSLAPERSRGAEAGIAWRDQSGAGAELNIFANRFTELVDFAPNPAPGRFLNLGRVITRGAELSGEAPWGSFLIQAAVSLLATEDTSGVRLLRRPSLTNNLAVAYRARPWSFTVNLRYVGPRDDLDPLSFTRERLPSFYTVAASATRQLGAGFKTNARVENLLNRRYQETSGYGVSPLAFSLGVEAEL